MSIFCSACQFLHCLLETVLLDACTSRLSKKEQIGPKACKNMKLSTDNSLETIREFIKIFQSDVNMRLQIMSL